MNTSNNLNPDEGDLVYRYSRAQALADGVLIDVTDIAREAGFRVAVAMTATAWADCVAWSEADSQRQVNQVEAGRLWDLLWLAHLAARRADSNRVAFELHRVPRRGRRQRPRRTTLHMHIGPGDQAEPVITVMLPGED